MAEQVTIPPPNKMIQELKTPDHTYVFFRELVQRESTRFQQENPIKRGTLYSTTEGADPQIVQAFPDLVFCKETVPLGSSVASMNQDKWVIWNWTEGEDSESTFNAEISYLGDAIGNPVFARRYTLKRDDYEANPFIVPGTPLTALLGVKVINGGQGYTHATPTFIGNGTGANVDFVFDQDGAITEAIVTSEGTGFDLASQIEVIGDGTGAIVAPIIQPFAAILTSQKKSELPENDPMSFEFVSVLRVYEVLPGPYIPFTRYDENLGPIQGTRRAVLNTGQLGGQITPTTKTNYEGRDGSSIVSIELVEHWTNGTGTPGNPPFPELFWSTYSDERGTVQHTSQIVLSAFGGAFATFIRPAPGKVLRTWFEPYADNTFLQKKLTETWTEFFRYDAKVSSEFGGGIIAIQETTDEPGVQPVDPGYLVVSDELRKKSADEQTRTREVLAFDAAWPILQGCHTDEVTGIVVNFTKQFIPAPASYPGRDGSYRGPFIEIQPYDKWRSIQIVSKVDLTTLPQPEAWNTVHPVTFPPILLAIIGVWTDTQGREVAALAASAGAHVSRSSNGSIIALSRSGFRGYAPAVQARYYKYGSPLLADVPAPLKILPSNGSVILTGRSNSTGYTNGDDGSTIFSDSSTLAVHALDVSGHLVGNFQIQNDVHPMLLPAASATSGGGTIAAIVTLPQNVYMTVNIPQSTPTPEWLNVQMGGPGILYEVEAREWRFGIWVIDLIYIKGLTI